jgi:hypothetical protein
MDQTAEPKRRRPASRSEGVIAIVALLAAAALTTRAWTQSPPAATGLAGTWELAIPDAEAHARIDRAIEHAVAGLPPIIDDIAAGQLRSRTPLSREVDVALTDARIVVTFDNARYDTAPGTSQSVPMAGDPHEMVDVIQQAGAGRLRQTFSTSRGRRFNTFSISEDGATLSLEVSIQSDRLPHELRFILPYRRRVSG